MCSIKITDKLSLDLNKQVFIFNGRERDICKVEKIFQAQENFANSRKTQQANKNDIVRIKATESLEKMIGELKSLGWMYRVSNIGRATMEHHNKTKKSKYTIGKFFKFLKTIAEFEIYHDNKQIKRITHQSLKDVDIKIISIIES